MNGKDASMEVQNSNICGICEKSFTRKRSLNQHIQEMHTESDKVFSCDICPNAYFTKSRLVRHQETHGDTATCEICHSKFLTKGNLIIYLRIHDRKEEDKVTCKTCNCEFANLTLLNGHLKIQLNEKTNFKSKSQTRMTSI